MAKRKKSDEKKTIKKMNQNVKKVDGFAGLDREVWGKIIIVLIVFVVLGLFYLLTLYITGKENDTDSNTDNNTASTASISYDDIVLGKSFSMSEDEYLVIYYDKSDDEVSSTYSELVSNYNGKEDSLKVYTVDMSSAFNKGKATDGDSNRNPSNASELAIHGPTLIHFSNHAVSEYYEGESEITEYFG